MACSYKRLLSVSTVATGSSRSTVKPARYYSSLTVLGNVPSNLDSNRRGSGPSRDVLAGMKKLAGTAKRVLEFTISELAAFIKRPQVGG